MPKTINKITRAIDNKVERELWAKAAGRCEFAGCNELVYKSSLTQETVNVAEMAHIYAFSDKGTRGNENFAGKEEELNSVANLFLVCRNCHKTIDADKELKRYPAELLYSWKEQHEDRVRLVTGIHPSKKSHVVMYGGRVGEIDSPFDPMLAMSAMFPDWYPVSDKALMLSMKCEHEDKTPEFWRTEEAHLRSAFQKHLIHLIEEGKPNHFSIFARADQPLLVLLGALMTDKVPGVVYPLSRPTSWKWGEHPDGFGFVVHRPQDISNQPVMVISISGRITHDRVKAILGESISIWEITIDERHNSAIKSKKQVDQFVDCARKLVAEINEKHSGAPNVAVFPAMPACCAVEMGRLRMPKADLPWVVYDQNNKVGSFVRALEIGGEKS